MIKAIIFDFWNTLGYDKSNKNPIVEIAKTLNLMDRKVWYRPIEEGMMTKAFKSKKEAFLNLCKTTGVKPNEKLIRKLIKSYGPDKFNLFSDTIPTLKKLKKRFKLIIISNTECFFAKEFYRTNFDKYFDFVIFSCYTGIIKPDKRIFQMVLKKFGLPPEEVLVIGDNFKDDILPALRLGMEGVLIKRKTSFALSWKETHEYDKTIYTLEELAKYLDK